MDQDLRYALRLTALLALTAAIYLPTLRAGFVYEDHNGGYLEQPQAHSPKVSPVSRGLSTWSFRWGQTPRVFHAENLGLHLVNGVLLYAVAVPLMGTLAAFWTAAVFLLAAVQSETVAYLSARPELLLVTGLLLTLWCVRRRWRVAACLAGLVTLSTKESAVSLVALVPLFGWWTAIPWRIWAPLVAIWKAAIVAALWLNTAAVPIAAWILAPGWAVHLARQAAALWRLLALVVWPRGLTVDHDFAGVSIALGSVALIALAGCVVALWRARQAYPTVTFVGAWILACVLPRLVVPSTPGFTEFLTEHHLYLVLIGIALGVGTWVAGEWTPQGAFA